MIIGIVIGNVWATKKEDALSGLKLMVVRRIEATDDSLLQSFVAVDRVGAGIGEKVLVATGSAARQTFSTTNIPVDAAIVGILDDNVFLKGKYIGGIRIYGTINDAPEVINALNVDAVVIACVVSDEWLKVVKQILAPTGVKVTMFSFSETPV